MRIERTNTIGKTLTFVDYALEGESERYCVAVYAYFTIDESQKVYDKHFHVIITDRTNYASDYIMVKSLRDGLALAHVLGVM